MPNETPIAADLRRPALAPFPVTEKGFPAFRHLATALALVCAANLAQAQDAASAAPASTAATEADNRPKGSPDYEAARKSYLQGDLVGAMAILTPASDAGDADAQALLGYILDKAEFDDEAIAYYRKSAAQGNPEGVYGLATMYMSGDGVDKDHARAGELMRQAAAGGHSHAKRVMALAYIQKNEALLGASDQDSEEARGYLIDSANTGYLPSMEALAAAYTTGAFGFTPDAGKAEEWKVKISQTRKKPPRKGGPSQ